MSYQSVPKSDDPESAGPVATTLVFQVEKFRLWAYLAFWFMCFFAMVVSTFTVAPTLGPCGKDKGYGMQCSVLMETFGFNNICVYWDYSPAREATAMVYPLFEYLLIAYIIMDYFQIKNDFDNGICPKGMMTTTNILLWVKLVLVAWFRMIFVCSVLGDAIPFFGTTIDAVTAHTLGFFGMQFGLILIAFQNVTYLYMRGQGMWCFSPDMTKKLAVVYLVLLAIVTALKISWASSIFISGTPWISGFWPHLFDRTWMLLAAVLPIFFALNGIKKDPPMVVTITNTNENRRGTL